MLSVVESEVKKTPLESAPARDCPLLAFRPPGKFNRQDKGKMIR